MYAATSERDIGDDEGKTLGLRSLRDTATDLRSAFYERLPDILEVVVGETTPVAVQPGKPASRFRGITKHKRTQRYEAHFWEQKKQVYLGGFQHETHAAKCHDIMALKCKGPECEALNFSSTTYASILPFITCMTQEDVVAELRHYSKDQAAKIRAAAESMQALVKVAEPTLPAGTQRGSTTALPGLSTRWSLDAPSALSLEVGTVRTLVLEDVPALPGLDDPPGRRRRGLGTRTPSILGKRGATEGRWQDVAGDESFLWLHPEDEALTLDDSELSLCYSGGDGTAPTSLGSMEHIDGAALFQTATPLPSTPSGHVRRRECHATASPSSLGFSSTVSCDEPFQWLDDVSYGEVTWTAPLPLCTPLPDMTLQDWAPNDEEAGSALPHPPPVALQHKAAFLPSPALATWDEVQRFHVYRGTVLQQLPTL